MRIRCANRDLRLVPAFAAGEMARAAGSGLAESEVIMIRTLYAVVQQRCWSRDRLRRVAAVLDRERAIALADLDRLEAMASQLAEIRALPEALEPQR
jgi:hypothetical protein